MSNVLRWDEEQLKNYQARRMLDAVKYGIAVERVSPQEFLNTPPAADIKTSRQKASPGKAKTGSKESPLEAMLDKQMALSGLHGYIRQHKHIKGRRFSLDFAFLDRKVGIEVQGQCHRIKAMFERDIEKRILATLAGWIVIEVSGKTIRSGQAVQWIAALINGQSAAQPSRDPKPRPPAAHPTT